MHSSAPWRARLRPEYRWPYPSLDPDQWYAIRRSWATLEHGKWVWLDSEPCAVEVLADHLEPLRIGPPPGEEGCSAAMAGGNDGTRREIRVARLRARAAESYASIPPGVWLDALSLAQVAAPHPRRSKVASERRQRRLPDEHFEFRTETLTRT
jgi:hypothetical protein